MKETQHGSCDGWVSFTDPTYDLRLQQERQAKEMAIERANRLEQLLREAGISIDDNS